MNNSLSNIFKVLLLLERYHKHCLAVLAATGMNGLNDGKECVHVSMMYTSVGAAIYWRDS